MKIFISGPVTGIKDYKDYIKRFEAAEKELAEAGHTVVNPAKVNAGLPEGTTHRQYMDMSLQMLDMCDTIFMLEGWERSRGCNAELARAVGNRMTIVFEGGKGCQGADRPGQESLPQRPGMKFIIATSHVSSAG